MWSNSFSTSLSCSRGLLSYVALVLTDSQRCRPLPVTLGLAAHSWVRVQPTGQPASPSCNLPLYSLSVYLNLSVCLSVSLSVCQSVYQSVYLSVSIYLSIWLSVYLSICLTISLSLYLSIYIYLSICQSVYLSISLSIYIYLSTSPSVHVSNHLSDDSILAYTFMHGVMNTQLSCHFCHSFRKEEDKRAFCASVLSILKSREGRLVHEWHGKYAWPLPAVVLSWLDVLVPNSWGCYFPRGSKMPLYCCHITGSFCA